jgi:uncharacterized membrane protein
MDSRIPFVLIFLLLIGMSVQVALQYNQLPNPCPSHWDSNGQVNGYSTPSQLIALYCGLMLGFACLFTLLAWLLPKIKPTYLNIPDKEWWILHPTDLKEMLKSVGAYLLYLCLVIMLFLFGTFQANFTAAITNSSLNSIGVIVGVVVLIVVVIVILGLMFRMILGRKDALSKDPTL